MLNEINRSQILGDPRMTQECLARCVSHLIEANSEVPLKTMPHPHPAAVADVRLRP